MKRFLLILAAALTLACNLHAVHVNEAEARLVASNYFSSKSARLSSHAGTPAAPRLVYRAQQERFYIFDRGNNGGFVVVAGDDRLPQVLGYGDKGDFSLSALPSNVQYWVDEMNRQIEYLQSHDQASAHAPAQRDYEVKPLLKTIWDQGSPYNDLCPTYSTGNGGTARAVTGCVATAAAQIMNYHQWPDVGRGSHTYVCNVNGATRTTLSADYSQSVYRWDLMRDFYNSNSSPESCQAVAKLMSDVGIAVNMDYGSSSGAHEADALQAFKDYFKYTNKAYLLHCDYYGPDEWDQIMVDELSARRPVLYCGYSQGVNGIEGHAFVLDGFDTDGYFHVNWGWGGAYDGYFLVTVLAPMSGTDFKFGQDGIFGLVPEGREDEVADVLYARGQMMPKTPVVQLGDAAQVSLDNLMLEGNALDTAGYHSYYGRKFYYVNINMKLSLMDSNGVERHTATKQIEHILSDWFYQDEQLSIVIPEWLEDGEYKIKLTCSQDTHGYGCIVGDYSGKELYVKMIVSDGVAYLKDCFLSNYLVVDSFLVPRGITTSEPFTVGVKISNYSPWSSTDGLVGNLYLSLLKDGDIVATSELSEVAPTAHGADTIEMQLTAPDLWGEYDLVVCDESGNRLMEETDNEIYIDAVAHIMVLPPCHELLEDFEAMTANSSTADENVQGNFTLWNFAKCGIRNAGEGNCYGANAVMMKKPSIISTSQPLSSDFFMAQATFFNPTSTLSKYRMEYSVDGGTTWLKVNSNQGSDVVEVPAKSQFLATWMLHLSASQKALFRISMFGGGNAATYVDDICLYFTDPRSDVNKDGEVNVADINVVIDAITGLNESSSLSLDVNQDGEINVADINTIINLILSR